MTTKRATAALAVIAAIIAAWWLIRPESEFQVLNAVPASFQGAYAKIFEEQPGDLWPYDDTNGVEFVLLETNRIGIRKWKGDLSRVDGKGGLSTYSPATLAAQFEYHYQATEIRCKGC
jgi:hypothetical protein